MLAEFLIVSLVLAIIPGTGVIFAISCGLSQGKAGALWGALAGSCGVVPHLIAAGLGLSALLVAQPGLYAGLRIAGGLYLIYLAVRAWRTRRDTLNARPVPLRGSRIVMQGALINLLNPKLTLFFVAFLPQFIPPDTTNPQTLVIGMGAILVAETFVVFLLYGLLAAGLNRHLRAKPRIGQFCNECVAVLFAGLGLRILAGTR